MDKKYRWHKVAATEDELNFPANNLLQLEIAGKKICIAKGDKLYACTAKCPHAGGILAEGLLDSSNTIVCPLHRYKYSLQNGINTSGEGYYLKTYPLKISSEGVFVGMEETGLFSRIK